MQNTAHIVLSTDFPIWSNNSFQSMQVEPQFEEVMNHTGTQDLAPPGVLRDHGVMPHVRC